MRFTPVVTCTLALVLAGCGDKPEEPSTETIIEPIALPVVVTALAGGEVSDIMRAQARIEAQQRIDLITTSRGVIGELPVREGDRVEAGQLLAQLSALPEDGKSFQEAQTAFARAQRDLKRREALLQKAPGAISDSEMDEIRDDLKDAETELQHLTQLNTERRITAPYAGVVSDITQGNNNNSTRLLIGQQLSAGSHVMRLRDTSAYLVPLDLPETTIDRLTVGLKASVSPLSGSPAEGLIQSLPGSIDPETGTGKVFVRVDNPPVDWRPGAFVVVECQLSATQADMVAQRAWVHFRRNRAYVWELYRDLDDNETLKVRRSWVKLGQGDEERVIINAEIPVGSLIVSDGSIGLNDGIPVSISNENAEELPPARGISPAAEEAAAKNKKKKQPGQRPGRPGQ